jgi:hypothetical protein
MIAVRIRTGVAAPGPLRKGFGSATSPDPGDSNPTFAAS